jgi:hypothetical protein
MNEQNEREREGKRTLIELLWLSDKMLALKVKYCFLNRYSASLKDRNPCLHVHKHVMQYHQ